MEEIDKEIAKLYKTANTYVLEDFADDVMSLIESHTKKAEDKVLELARTPCECGKDHFGLPVRSVQGSITTCCQFSRVHPSTIDKDTKE